MEEKGFGKWFDALFPLIKGRDSCQPEQSIEPSAAPSESSPSTPFHEYDVDGKEGEDVDETHNKQNKQEKHFKNMFIPVRKRKKERTIMQSQSVKY